MNDRRPPLWVMRLTNWGVAIGVRLANVGFPVVVFLGISVSVAIHNASAGQAVVASSDASSAPSPEVASSAGNEAATSDATDTKDAADMQEPPIQVIGPGSPPPESLEPLMKIARRAKARFESEVDAYTCLIVKRETIEGKLGPAQYLRLKIRDRRLKDGELVQPLSIYAKFLKPAKVAGREVLYVESERDGDLLVRRGGTRLPNLTLKLDPDGLLARTDTNYSIKQTGIRPMLEQILARMESQPDDDQVQIRLFADAKVDGRPCRHIEIRQLKRRENSDYQIAKVYVDDELQFPVYFASYSWAEEEGGVPVLQEQYVITKIDLEAELTDLDFDRNNPAYKFKKEDDAEY